MSEQDPHGPHDAEHVRVVVWTRDRSQPADDPRRSILARLRELDAAGLVDEVSVRVWGKQVDASDGWPEETSPPVRDRVAEFRTWAERNGHSLEPAFHRCDGSTMVSDERTEVIRLPLVCLAIYDDDRLVGVFPCSTGEGTETVGDCLRRLETGEFVGTSTTG